MSRQQPVAAREMNAAEEVCDLFENAYELYLIAVSDGRITQEEDRMIRDANARVAAAHDRNIDAAHRTDQVLRLIAVANETAMEGRRFREQFGRFTLITGGLGELGPGAA